MKETIGKIVSRLRQIIKAVNQDSFVTDRFLYSLFLKYGRAFIRREDGGNKLNRIASIFEPLDYVELEEVDTVTAGCAGIKSGITIKRTKFEIPAIFDGYYGLKIRSLSSLDGTEDMNETTPAEFVRISRSPNYKFNKKKYYWYEGGRFYFPNIKWPGVKMSALFEGDISLYGCDPKKKCKVKQDQPCNIPAYLFPEIEGKVLQELGISLQVPIDPVHDKQNINR